MADANWTTTTGANFVKTTYDRYARFAYRPVLRFDQVATEKATMLAMPGSPVTFNFYPDYAPATTELDEVSDPEYVVVSPTQKTITLKEYGNVARVTKKYRGLSYSVPGPDREVAELIGWNAALSQDTLARNVLVAGTNAVLAGSAASRAAIDSTDTITSSHARYVAAKLRGASVPGWNGDDIFVGFIHPDVDVDLREETGGKGWLEPANYNAPERVWNGTIGRYAGIDWVSTPRAAVLADAGANSTVDVYLTLVVGAGALGKAYSEAEAGPQAQFVLGPQVDRLRRHNTFGWYWLGGYGLLREEAIWRIESASSIGDNDS